MTQFNYLEENIKELFSVRENECLTLVFDFRSNVSPEFRVEYGGGYYYLLDVLYVDIFYGEGILKIIPYAYDGDEEVRLKYYPDSEKLYEIVNMLFALDAYDLEAGENGITWGLRAGFEKLGKLYNRLYLNQLTTKNENR